MLAAQVMFANGLDAFCECAGARLPGDDAGGGGGGDGGGGDGDGGGGDGGGGGGGDGGNGDGGGGGGGDDAARRVSVHDVEIWTVP